MIIPGVSPYTDGWHDGYEKGRADAIDECIEEIYRIAKSTTNVNKYLIYEDIVKKLERLKERK